MPAPHRPLSQYQPLSKRGMPLLCSLAMHGLLAAAALWLTLPKPSHAPRPEPFMTVQFVAAPPALIATPAPAPVAPPAQEAAAPQPPAAAEPLVQEPAVQEPLVEAPSPLPAENAAEVLPLSRPEPPKPVVKPKPQPRVAAKPPKTQPVETQSVETKPVETETPPVAAAAPPPVEAPPVPVPVPASAAIAPEAPAIPAAAPAHAAAVATAPAEIQSSEPPVLRHPGFRNRPQPPVYPVRARQLEQEGVSVVRALIDPEGQSREVRLWRSSGYEMLDQAALNAVRGWAFNAARIGERPVLAWVEIPVQFKLR